MNRIPLAGEHNSAAFPPLQDSCPKVLPYYDEKRYKEYIVKGGNDSWNPYIHNRSKN